MNIVPGSDAPSVVRILSSFGKTQKRRATEHASRGQTDEKKTMMSADHRILHRERSLGPDTS